MCKFTFIYAQNVYIAGISQSTVHTGFKVREDAGVRRSRAREIRVVASQGPEKVNETQVPRAPDGSVTRRMLTHMLESDN